MNACDFISGVAVELVGLDVRVQFGDSRSNRSRDIRPAHFVMDDERRRTTADGPCGNRPNALQRIAEN